MTTNALAISTHSRPRYACRVAICSNDGNRIVYYASKAEARRMVSAGQAEPYGCVPGTKVEAVRITCAAGVLGVRDDGRHSRSSLKTTHTENLRLGAAHYCHGCGMHHDEVKNFL